MTSKADALEIRMPKWIWGVLVGLAGFLLHMSVQVSESVQSSRYNGDRLREISTKLDALASDVIENRGRIIALEVGHARGR